MSTHLLLIGGLAASGKTALGQELARLTAFAFLDKDTLTRPLVEAMLSATGAPGGIDDRHSSFYLNQVRPYEYAAFMNTIVENVSLGVSVIAVAPFLLEMADGEWSDRLQQQLPEASVHKIWIDAPDALLQARLSSRALARDRQKLDNWPDYIRAGREIKPVKTCKVIQPQGSESARTLAEQVLHMLSLSN